MPVNQTPRAPLSRSKLVALVLAVVVGTGFLLFSLIGVGQVFRGADHPVVQEGAEQLTR